MLSVELNDGLTRNNGEGRTGDLKARTALFILLLTSGLGLYWLSVNDIFSSHTDYYSHVPVLYLVFCVILFRERKRIFASSGYSLLFGSPAVLLSAAAFAYTTINKAGFSPNDYCSVLSCAMMLFTAGIFLLCFGPAAFKKAAFPLFLLILAIPLPDFLLSRLTVLLRHYSTSATCWILGFFHIFPIREGFILTLPEITLEVAEQCSGIRSSIALLIISVLYGRYYLKTMVGRVLLVGVALVALPIKNGLRISSLTILSIYWDRSVLSGSLHTSGGMLFFGVSLVWVMLMLFLLAKLERIAQKR